jgi:hypothetical protein
MWHDVTRDDLTCRANSERFLNGGQHAVENKSENMGILHVLDRHKANARSLVGQAYLAISNCGGFWCNVDDEPIVEQYLCV